MRRLTVCPVQLMCIGVQRTYYINFCDQPIRSIDSRVSAIKNIHRIFTGNCGKVTYYISGSITHKFMKFLYLDYHSWTCITTNFRYHSLSFDIRNGS